MFIAQFGQTPPPNPVAVEFVKMSVGPFITPWRTCKTESLQSFIDRSLATPSCYVVTTLNQPDVLLFISIKDLYIYTRISSLCIQKTAMTMPKLKKACALLSLRFIVKPRLSVLESFGGVCLERTILDNQNIKARKFSTL